MKEKLRKITFSLAYYYFEPDLTDEQHKEQEEETRQRNGYFHKWVEESDISPQTQEPYTKTLALVEDIETGKMYKVEPDLIKFQK